MRNRILATLCMLTLCGPALAQEDQQGAQGDEQQGQGQDEGGEQGGQEVAPSGGDQVKTAPEGGSDVAPGEVHTVVKGDTLWDLSQQYLGSPWYWPKVWSYNPEIANPHWIYPGNKVRFFPAGEEAPSRVEVGEAPEQVPGEEDTGEVEPGTMIGEEGGGTVTTAGKIGYVPKNSVSIILDGFLTAKELAEAGRIDGSFSEAEMLSAPETVYIKFKNKNAVKIGDAFVIFHTEKPVTHPVTGANLGYMTRFVGKVKVVSVSNDYVTAAITDTWDEIHRGDLIGPANEELHLHAARRANEKAMTATLVDMLVPYLELAGEHQLVLVDRGSADGVQPGNTFNVVRRGDGFVADFIEPQKNQDKKWPEETIGACMVIDVKDRASTCLMTRSIREVFRGDQLVMKVEGGSQPTAQR